MKLLFLITWMFLSVFIYGQDKIGLPAIIATQTNNSHVPVYSQQQINDIKIPGEGFCCLNSTTNCINYYLNNQWNELCGSCIPKPPLAPDVDSILIDDADIIIKFKSDSSNSNKELYAILLPDSIVTYTTTNQLKFKNVATGNHLVRYYYKNKCGDGISKISSVINIQPKDICGNVEMEFNEQQISINTFLNKCWFTSDITSVPNVNSKDVFISKEGNYYYNSKIVNNKNVCPPGFHLPTLNEAEELSKYLLGNESRIARFSPSLVGSYSLKEKIVNNGTGSAYWIKVENAEKVLMVNKLGTMIVDVTKQNVYTTIRCVKD